jgi:hypothetical protein
MNIENMTRDEQIKLYYQLEKALGWYGIVTLCVEDVSDYISENEMPMPSEAGIAQACAYVSRKHNESSYPFIEWAAELAIEIHQAEEQA